MAVKELYIKLRKHKEYLEDLGYHVVMIGLYGSYNYNLNDEESDFDTKAVVLPQLEDLLLKKDFNRVYDHYDGQIDVKDVMSFYNVVKSGNESYLQAVHTQYVIGDAEFITMMKKHELNPKALVGAMRQKVDAIEKNLPNSYELMDEIGYDPKQYHHILRLYDILIQLKDTHDYSDFIIEYNKDKRTVMLNHKRHPHLSKEDVLEHSKKLIKEVESYDYKSYEKLDQEEGLVDYVKKTIVGSLINTSGLDYSVNQHRTFGSNIPKRDKLMFPQLKDLEQFDISYTIYSYLEILDWGEPFEK